METQRRNFIVRTAALAALASTGAARMAGLAFAEEGTPAKKAKGGAHSAHSAHSGHDHSTHPGPANMALFNSSRECAGRGEACLEHCIEVMSTGDNSMADCAKSVRDMMLYCEALAKAANQGSKRTKQLAKLTLDSCIECEKACLKHEEMKVCKACAESCVDCAKQCKIAMA